MDIDNITERIPGDAKREGKITKAIESQTAKLPSGLFLALGAGSIALALAAKASGRARTANFIAQWVPTILIMGLYNKFVKVEGSDRRDLH
jgi:hypothetical protein